MFAVAAASIRTTAQTPPPCAPDSITIDRTSLTIDAVGTFFRDDVSLFVQTPGNCTWTVSAGGFVRTASGRDTYTERAAAVQFVAGANPDTAERSTTIVINGLAIAVFQRGHPLRTAPMDLDGDGRSDVCTRFVFGGIDPYDWTCMNSQHSFTHTFRFGRHPDQMVPADYNGDHIVDVAAFRPSTGEWFILEAGVIRTVKWGLPGDIPVPADYDGDGKADVAVYRPANGYWYVPGVPAFTMSDEFQSPTPVPGDYDGDGRAEPALLLRSPSGFLWKILDRQRFVTVRWGQAGDIPVPGDYDGDGSTDIAVFRPATGQWFIRNVGTIQWGAYGDIPLPLDVDGVGHVAPVVLRQTATDDLSGMMFVRHDDGSASVFDGSFLPLIQRPVMLSTTAGETHGAPDRRADVTLFRPAEGAWYFWSSINGYIFPYRVAWGLASDQPVGADPGCVSAAPSRASLRVINHP